MDLTQLVEWAWAAWALGPGATEAIQVEAAARAGESVRLFPSALAGQVYPAVGGEESAWIEPSVWLEVEVGPAGLARRRAWGAAEARADALRVDAGAAWVRGTVDGWLDAWIAEGERVHLAAHLAEIDAELSALDAGVGAHLSALDLADLQAERARYRIEVEAATTRAAVARGRLAQRLGGLAVPTTDGVWLERDLVLPEGDPWATISPGQLPGPRAALAAVAAAEADRQAACRDWGVAVSAGLASRTDAPAGATTAYLAASLPIGGRRPDACAFAKGQAEASARAAVWAEAEAAATVGAGSQLLAAARAQVVALEADSVGPLAARQALLDRAWDARQVPLSRVLAARWTLHEAEHAALLARADLLRVWVDGELVRQAMEAM